MRLKPDWLIRTTVEVHRAPASRPCDLGELVPGTLEVVATTSQASLQPVSSATIQRESGRDVRSTHEMFCEPIDCQADDEVEVTFAKSGVTERYRVNGRPQDWGTHLEVALLWLQS